MPRPIPDSLAAGFPEGLQQPSYVSEDTLRVLGGTGLPGDQVVSRMGELSVSKESGEITWDVAVETLETTHRLFQQISPGEVDVPELSEFGESDIDFEALQAGYEAYERAGMAPELLFVPVYLELQTWRDSYGKLRQWQDRHYSSSDFRLKQQSDGDGLYVNTSVASNWHSLNHQVWDDDAPGSFFTSSDGGIWRALVVPTASIEQGGLVVNTSHDLSEGKDNLLRQAQATSIPLEQITPINAHMPIDAYLLLQAMRIYKNIPPIDSGFMWTWNAGTYEDEDNSLQAPASGWSPSVGRVVVGHYEVSGSSDSIGVRVPVWGKS
jgi:hypothetical protein